ncbi:MAG: hypothetical protein CVU38_04285 [Chloroflexi bacterium HGW-Chloroflexi-1]|nr:MAG: hypothetical protein CVU38_04285 [Chloroflexi bacterium HGW-Chloroflexi-1]
MRKHRVTKFVAGLLLLAALVVFVIGVVATILLARGGLGYGWGIGGRGWVSLLILGSAFVNALGLLVLGAVLFFLAQIEINLSVARDRQEAALAAAARARTIEAEARVVAVEEPSLPEAPSVAEAAVVAPEVVAGVVAPELLAEAPGAPRLAVAEAPPFAQAEMLETPAPLAEVSAPPVRLPQVEISELEVPEAKAAIPGMAAEVEAAVPAAPEVALPAAPVEAVVTDVTAKVEAAVPVVELPEAPIGGLPEGKISLKLPGTEEAARIAAEMKALKAVPNLGARVEVPALAETATLPKARRPDDLTVIKGIGPAYARKLRAVGILTFAALAEASDELLEELTAGNLERVVRDDWRGQARRLSA